MFTKRTLIYVMTLLASLFAKNEEISIEGEWVTKSVNNKEVKKSIAVITKDSIVTYNNFEEDTREAYLLNGDTLITNTDTSIITISNDQLTIQGARDTILLTKFDPEKLSESSQNLIRKIKGDWFIWGFLSNDSLSHSPYGEIMEMKINNNTIDVYRNGKRVKSSGFSINKDTTLTILNDKIFIDIYRDTLKMTVADNESLILLPIKYAPSIDTVFLNEKEHCAVAIGTITMLINHSAMYEAETGEFAHTLDELIKVYGISISDNIWEYTYHVKEDAVIIRATLKDGIAIGEIASGNFIELTSNGEGYYSHENLKEKYLGYLLDDAKLVEK